MTDRSRRAMRCAACTVLIVGSLMGLLRLARSRTIQVCGGIVPRVETRERVVALTFDDGPVGARVDGLLSVLADAGVPATFFVTGADIEGAPGAARSIVAAGHELGNHSYSHVHMVLRSQAFIQREIERTDQLIRESGEDGEIFFRPPYTWKLIGLPWFLWKTGRTTVTWDVEPDSYPSVAATPEGIVSYVKEHVRPGSIILLHVWWACDACRSAIPGIAKELRDDGYRFVTVRELLKKRAV